MYRAIGRNIVSLIAELHFDNRTRNVLTDNIVACDIARDGLTFGRGTSVVSRIRRIVLDVYRDRRWCNVAIGIRCVHAELERDNVVRVAAIGMIELFEQFERVRAVRGERQREDRNAIGLTFVCAAVQADHDGNAAGGQVAVQFRTAACERSVRRNRTGTVCAVRCRDRTRFGDNAGYQIGFVDRFDGRRHRRDIIDACNRKGQVGRVCIAVVVFERIYKGIDALRIVIVCCVAVRARLIYGERAVLTDHLDRTVRWDIISLIAELDFRNRSGRVLTNDIIARDITRNRAAFRGRFAIVNSIRCVIFYFNGNRSVCFIVVAIFGFHAKIQCDFIVRIITVSMVKLFEQLERIRTVRLDREGEHRHAVCFTFINIAVQIDHDSYAAGGQSAVQFRTARGERTVSRNRTGAVRAEIGRNNACFSDNTRSKVGFIDHFHSGRYDGRLVIRQILTVQRQFRRVGIAVAVFKRIDKFIFDICVMASAIFALNRNIEDQIIEILVAKAFLVFKADAQCFAISVRDTRNDADGFIRVEIVGTAAFSREIKRARENGFNVRTAGVYQRDELTVIGFLGVARVSRAVFIDEIQRTGIQIDSGIVIVEVRAIGDQEKTHGNRACACRVADRLAGRCIFGGFNNYFFRAQYAIGINREHAERVVVASGFADIFDGDRIAFINRKIARRNAQRLLFDSIKRCHFIKVRQGRTRDELFFLAVINHAAIAERLIRIRAVCSDRERAVLTVDRDSADSRNVNFVAAKSDLYDRVVVRTVFLAVGRQDICCASATIQAADDIAVGNAECRIICVEIVVRDRTVIFYDDADGTFRAVTIAVRCDHAEIQRNFIIRI